jgi:hypothetical protein
MEDKTVISDRLFTTSKPKTTPCTLKYINVMPITGRSASGGSTITFRIPAGSPSSYFDPAFSFLRCQLETSIDAQLGPAGISSLFSHVSVKNGGQHISSCNEFSTWLSMHNKMSVTNDYRINDGNIIQGMSNIAFGETIYAGPDRKRTYCDFLPNFSGFFGTNKYIPTFTSESLEITFTLGANNFGLSYSSGNIDGVSLTDVEMASVHAGDPEGLKLHELELVIAVLDVDKDTNNAIIEAHNGLWKYQINNYQSFRTIVPINSRNFHFPIGLSVKSLTAIHAVLMPVRGFDDHQYSTFIKDKLKSCHILIDGSPLAYIQPQQIEHSAVSKCFERISNHALSDYSVHGSHGFGLYELGSFVMSWDTEQLQSKSTIRSGVNVGRGVSQIQLEFTDTIDAAMNLVIFCQFDALVSMDLAGTRLWESSQ